MSTLKHMILTVLLLAVAFAGAPSFAQNPKIGILLLAHGGSPEWNAEVLKVAKQVDPTTPVEVAFGMATKRTLQEGIDRLVERGVKRIVAVPLFVSSHSSVITSTEYLLGLRAQAPPELAAYARMDHGVTEHEGHTAGNTAAFDPATPVRSSAPIVMARALDRHPIISDILLSRAKSISETPDKEVVILVAHGPVSDQENDEWLDDMQVLAGRIRSASEFHEIEYLTVRDDAPEPIRAKATAELRAKVERANLDGRRVLVVPLLLSYGGIETGIQKRLEGLPYTMSPQALLPDDRLVRWVFLAADSVDPAGTGR